MVGSSKPHLIIMAAGTGGHVMPGLAVAREMLRRGWSVSWMGTPTGMEHRLVAASGLDLPMDVIGFAGLRGKGAWGALRGGVQLLRGVVQAWALMRALMQKRGATAVLGMGGYVCFPGGLAARWLGLPLMLVNADAALLLSNRSLLRWADRIAFGFDGEAARRTPRGLVTGNPVRPEMEAIAPPLERFAGRSGPLKVLVVGGSLGARVLNETMPQALALLAPAERPHVTHQTGQAHWASVQADYAKAGVEAQIVPFIDDMAAQLAACDVILCRAGAITVSELCAAGVASVLVPLVVSTTRHQRDNAAWLAGQQAAMHLPQTELSAARLAQVLKQLERTSLLTMASRARQLAQPHAAQRVADELDALIFGQIRKDAA
jgi:UDP-N-acetylglucosamine--N-acetylmuramyl-(pentapeptide) pyrophosphoryl-undecaprenol N-acetylglucosamine transferase